MEIFMNVWLALNIVFGLWTIRNKSVTVFGMITGRGSCQSDFGKILDLVVISSCLAYYFTTNTPV